MPNNSSVLYSAQDGPVRDAHLSELSPVGGGAGGRDVLKPPAASSEPLIIWGDAVVSNERSRTRRRWCMCCVLWVFNVLTTIAVVTILWQIFSAQQHFLVLDNRRDHFVANITEKPTSALTHNTTKKLTIRTTTMSTPSTNEIFIPYTGTNPPAPDYDSVFNVSDIRRILDDYADYLVERQSELETAKAAAAGGRRRARAVAGGPPVQKLPLGVGAAKAAVLHDAARLADKLLPRNLSTRWGDQRGAHGERGKAEVLVGAVAEDRLVKNATERDVVVIIRKKTLTELGKGKVQNTPSASESTAAERGSTEAVTDRALGKEGNTSVGANRQNTSEETTRRQPENWPAYGETLVPGSSSDGLTSHDRGRGRTTDRHRVTDSEWEADFASSTAAETLAAERTATAAQKTSAETAANQPSSAKERTGPVRTERTTSALGRSEPTVHLRTEHRAEEHTVSAPHSSEPTVHHTTELKTEEHTVSAPHSSESTVHPRTEHKTEEHTVSTPPSSEPTVHPRTEHRTEEHTVSIPHSSEPTVHPTTEHKIEEHTVSAPHSSEPTVHPRTEHKTEERTVSAFHSSEPTVHHRTELKTEEHTVSAPHSSESTVHPRTEHKTEEHTVTSPHSSDALHSSESTTHHKTAGHTASSPRRSESTIHRRTSYRTEENTASALHNSGSSVHPRPEHRTAEQTASALHGSEGTVHPRTEYRTQEHTVPAFHSSETTIHPRTEHRAEEHTDSSLRSSQSTVHTRTEHRTEGHTVAAVLSSESTAHPRTERRTGEHTIFAAHSSESTVHPRTAEHTVSGPRVSALSESTRRVSTPGPKASPSTTTTTTTTRRTTRASTTVRTTPVLPPCLRDWTRWRDFCYKPFPYRVTWKEARRFCRYHMSYLSSVHSEDENDFLIGRFGPVCSQGRCRAITGIHIGLNDREREGHYVWTDGSRTDLFRWSRGEPSNSVAYGGRDGEDCAELRVVFGFGEWNDIGCSTVRRPFVCKSPLYYHTRLL